MNTLDIANDIYNIDVTKLKKENYQDCYSLMKHRIEANLKDFMRLSIEDMLEEKNWIETFKGKIPKTETTLQIFFLVIDDLERSDKFYYDLESSDFTKKHEMVSYRENEVFYQGAKARKH